MSRFDVIALGVGDTFSEVHTTASLLLVADDFKLAIDCPDRYRGVLKKAASASGQPVTLDEIDDVFITHVHGDHMNGLEGVAFFKRFAQRRRVKLHACGEVGEVIWPRRLRAPMETLWDGSTFHSLGFEDYFDFTPRPWGREFDLGPLRVTLRRTKHHVPTAAMLVRAAGRTLGYSSDTAFDPDLIAFLSCADVIIHETNLGPAHTAYSDLLSLPPELRRKIRLIHYPDTFDVAGSELPCLAEGDVVSLA